MNIMPAAAAARRHTRSMQEQEGLLLHQLRQSEVEYVFGKVLFACGKARQRFTISINADF
jgi:hypothetical protein